MRTERSRSARASVGYAFGAAVLLLAIATLSACGGSGMEIVSFSSPVAPGEEAVVTVRAPRGSSCEVAFEYKGQPGSPAALPAMQINNVGFATWEWRFDNGVVRQEIDVVATCTVSGSAETDRKTLSIR